MAQFNIFTRFAAKDNFSSTIARMGQSTANFKQKAGSAFSSIDSKMKNLNSTSNGLLGGIKQLAGGLAIGSLMLIASQGILNYDKNLHSLQAITGVTGKQFVVFKSYIDATSKALKVGGEEVAKTFEIVGSKQPELLKSADALNKVATAALILKKASGMELEESVNSLTSTMNQFALKADDSNRVMNVLAAGAKEGSAGIGFISESMDKFGAVANASNLQVEQAVALIEVLATKNMVGANSGEALKRTMLRLKASGLGYKSGLFNINDALSEMTAKMNNLRTAQQKDMLMKKTFGDEGITAGTIIMSNVKLFEELTKKVTGTSEAQIQATINSSSLSNRLEELKSSFVSNITATDNASVGINIFSSSLQFLTNNMSSIMSAVGMATVAYVSYNAILLLSKAYTIASSVALGIQSAIIGVNSANIHGNTIAKIANMVAMGSMTAATTVATAAQWALNIAMNANPIGLIISGVALLAGGVYLLYKNWDSVTAGIVNFGKVAWNIIRKLGSFIFSMLVMPIKLVLDGISAITGADWATKASEGISSFSKTIAGDVINNTVTSQQLTTERYESISKQQATLNINDRTGLASVDKSSTNMPYVLNTAGGF